MKPFVFPLVLMALMQPLYGQSPENAEPPLPADLFAHLAANTWAFPNVDDMHCDENPHEVRFDSAHSTAWFTWRGPMVNYLGEPDQEGGYDVIESDESSITLSLHGEQRMTEAGHPVVWILRMLDGGEAYCWDRTDWSPPRCTHLHVRCHGPAPMS